MHLRMPSTIDLNSKEENKQGCPEKSLFVKWTESKLIILVDAMMMQLFFISTAGGSGGIAHMEEIMDDVIMRWLE